MNGIIYWSVFGPLLVLLFTNDLSGLVNSPDELPFFAGNSKVHSSATFLYPTDTSGGSKWTLTLDW